MKRRGPQHSEDTRRRLGGHSGTTVTELVYRHQLKPVIQTGATAMDQIFGRKSEGA